MDRIPLKAQERELLGKKVKKLRKDGFIPGHVFGSKKDVEHVTVKGVDFLKVLKQAGETALVDLRIGDEKVRPVLIRETDYDPRSGDLVHIGFYQVNLKEKVTVPVPIVLEGEGPESIKLGETVVLQNLAEVNVEALPTDLIENIVVNIDVLKEVEDAITVDQLNYDHSKLTILAEPNEVVVKLAPAVTEEMQQLLEEQEAEAEAAVEVAAAEAGEEAPKEGEEGAEGETTGEQSEAEGNNEEKPAEES